MRVWMLMLLGNCSLAFSCDVHYPEGTCPGSKEGVALALRDLVVMVAEQHMLTNRKVMRAAVLICIVLLPELSAAQVDRDKV